MNTNNQLNRIEELDALRGIASLMVVLFHFTMGREEAKFGFKLGTTGVDLFFMISGFVIFMSLNKVKNSSDFIISRISRLYPTYWACVSFTFILVSAYTIYRQGSIPLIDYIANMTMFQHYLGVPNLDGPYWTMVVEMVFYIGILLLFHNGLIRHLEKVGIVLSTLVVILSVFFNNNFTELLFFWIPLLPFISLFFAGILFYTIYAEKRNHLTNYLMLVICLVFQIILFKFSGRSKEYISHVEYALMIGIYFILFTLFIKGRLKFIVTKLTLFFGKISFALYLIHQKIAVDFLIPILVNRLHINFWIASISISLPIVIGLATFVTYYIEIPFGSKMKKSLHTKLISYKLA